MEQSKLVFIVCDEGFRPDVMDVLGQHEILYYTLWSGAEGCGETGRKAGNPIWPGLNDVLMVALSEGAVQPLIDALHKARDTFPVRPGIRFIITDAVFV